jgi:hypothetical protein
MNVVACGQLPPDAAECRSRESAPSSRRFKLHGLPLRHSGYLRTDSPGKPCSNAGRRILTFKKQFLRLPRLPIAPYLPGQMRTRGLEPPTTAFSGLRVCQLRHVRRMHRGEIQTRNLRLRRLALPIPSEPPMQPFSINALCDGRIRTCNL